MSKLKVILASVLILAFIAGMIVLGIKDPTDEYLVVYNCEEYIEPSTIDAFEEYYQQVTGSSITVRYSTYDTNETMLTKVRNGDARIDVCVGSEYAIERMLKLDLLYSIAEVETLSSHDISNSALVNPYVDGKIAELFGDVEGENMRDYFVPYMYGTLGILYNNEVVTEEDLQTGWGLMLNEGGNPLLEGMILMKDSVRDSYAAAICYAYQNDMIPSEYASYSVGQLISCSDDALLAVAENVLNAQRPHLKGYEVDFGKDDMIASRAYVCLAWSGDAMYAIDEDPDGKLSYFVPELDGEALGNVWFDGWVIPKTADNLRGASMWVDFMCREDITMANMLSVGYTSARDPDILRLDEDCRQMLVDYIYEYEILEEDASDEEIDEFIESFFDDTVRYPETSTLLGVMQDYKNVDSAVSMWERVKAETIDLIPAILIGLGALGVVALIVWIATLPKRYRLKK